MSTQVFVNTYTHSVNYVTGQMVRSLKQIILLIGLDPSRLFQDWNVLQNGIFCWLNSGHLQLVALEIFHPKTDVLVGRWDFSISYSYGSQDDGSMWIDVDAIKHAIAKCGAIPSYCDYAVKVQNSDGAPKVSGWSSTYFRSTEGFARQSIGNAVAANWLAAQAGYWRKTT